ncbi:MAG: RNA repair transcriptional activator RtcR family protein [Ignavibacteria bacterium]
MKTSLISFVGTNDRGTDNKGGKSDGAIITALKERKFNVLHLIYNPTESGNTNFYDIAVRVKNEALKKKCFSKENIFLHSFECENVTDHNDIYPKLLKLCESLPKGIEYTAAIASGTPAMQVCWILMAESGDFKIKLIRSNEPRFGKPLVTEVILDTSLPQIKRLKEEKKLLIKDKLKTAPVLCVDRKHKEIKIGKNVLKLSPIEYSYYIYFINRTFKSNAYLETDIATMPEEFYKDIINIHRKSFPQADSIRMASEIAKGISTSTFRSNISKLNKKIKSIFLDNSLNQYYQITSHGSRFYKKYGIELPKEKIRKIN